MKQVFQKFLLVPFIVLAVSISNCKKENSQGTIAKPQIENFDKMVRFLSITLGVSEDRIEFNENTKEFYVPETVFRVGLKDIQKYYGSANEYKSKYEKHN